MAQKQNITFQCIWYQLYVVRRHPEPPLVGQSQTWQLSPTSPNEKFLEQNATYTLPPF